jgi:5-methylcytosine-specific restriction protein A
MTTFLLTWNPARYEWAELPRLIRRIEQKGSAQFTWSCGRTRRIRPDDHLFMLKQGREPRGIVGSGRALGESYADEHWEDERAPFPRQAVYVDVEWDVLAREPVIARRELDEPPFSEVNWSTQTSGISVPSDVARPLHDLWAARTGASFAPIPEEVDHLEFPPWATRHVYVNAYERDPRARAACIAHYGCRCVVCGFDFERRTGPDGRCLIQVHHLTPATRLRGGYAVNPVRDLRPLCPNCHALVHHREPPYALEEVQAMLAG